MCMNERVSVAAAMLRFYLRDNLLPPEILLISTARNAAARWIGMGPPCWKTAAGS
jgi:hypothetical protein